MYNPEQVYDHHPEQDHLLHSHMAYQGPPPATSNWIREPRPSDFPALPGEQWSSGSYQIHHQIHQPNPITQPLDTDATSLVAESYLSDHHVYQQPKDGVNLSTFQRDFLSFCTSIARFGSSKELFQLALGVWIFPIVVAQLAINDAGSQGYNEYYQFITDYKNLARHPENDIERIADLRLRHLAWTGTDDPPESDTMDGSLFLSRIARQVLFISTNLQTELISLLRSVCHDLVKKHPIFSSLQAAQFRPKQYADEIRRIKEYRIPLDAIYDPHFPSQPLKFRSAILHEVLAALLFFYWKQGAVAFVKDETGHVPVRILAIPAAFELRMLETSEWICKRSFLKALTSAEFLDIHANVKELDQMTQGHGPDFVALQHDLDELIKLY